MLSAPVTPIPPPQGKVFMTLPEALEKFFPDCEVKRTTAFLSVEQRERIAELSGQPTKTGMVFPYIVRKEGKTVGTVYLDRNRVRSLRQTLMVVVTPGHTVAKIELLAFAEPREYIPRGKWYEQFKGQKLDAELNLRRGIDGISGATLTARATLRAARRVLAIHKVLSEPGKSP